MIRFILLSLLLLPAAFLCLKSAVTAGKTGVITLRFSQDKILRSADKGLFELSRKVLFIVSGVLFLAWLQLSWSVFA